MGMGHGFKTSGATAGGSVGSLGCDKRGHAPDRDIFWEGHGDGKCRQAVGVMTSLRLDISIPQWELSGDDDAVGVDAAVDEPAGIKLKWNAPQTYSTSLK
ncbi:hypothetical protein E4U15_000612 [Claviceps sp. LM218 group G6]|nr:hypothetical protein E4U15_000612 [Claviceps sp. LM218 group G6]